MNPKDKLNAAQATFRTVGKLLESTYKRPIPFVLVYVHDDGEMLTNLPPEKVRVLLVKALEKSNLTPQDI